MSNYLYVFDSDNLNELQIFKSRNDIGMIYEFCHMKCDINSDEENMIITALKKYKNTNGSYDKKYVNKIKNEILLIKIHKNIK